MHRQTDHAPTHEGGYTAAQVPLVVRVGMTVPAGQDSSQICR